MSHPEGFSMATLPPDGTLMVEGWTVNVGAGTFTFNGQTVSETRIVAAATFLGERLRDSAPLEVTLVIPVEDVDRLIKRLEEARNVGLTLLDIEEGLDDG